jgi:virulence-associated protein VapD
MYAVAFDLVVKDTVAYHPKRDPAAAYRDIGQVLTRYGFEWRQGSLYTVDNDDMANLFAALLALKAMPWFPASVRDIRAFRVEQWSDFTGLVKGKP